MDTATLLLLGLLLVACVGLKQLVDIKRASRAAASSAYVQRYWQIADDLRRAGSDPHRIHEDPRYLQLLDDELAVAAIGLLEEQQWATWHGVLDEEPARTRVVDALQVCDPGTVGFPRLRRCLDQRQRDGARHDISRCAGA